MADFEGAECNGVCLYGSDLGLPYGGVAYAHPDCPEHGDPVVDEDPTYADYPIDDPEDP